MNLTLDDVCDKVADDDKGKHDHLVPIHEVSMQHGRLYWPGADNDGFGFAFSLVMLGNLPACLGYVGVVVLMLHSRSPLARVALLAPMGRMALSNYLTHSLVFTTLSYGYGLGTFGMERIWQAACVVLMIALQLPFSHWWLARFRYGPMEWLWRGFTYRETPRLRL